MNDLDLISEVKIEASSSGVAETNAQVNQLADGVEGLIVAQDGLSKAQIRVNAALEATAKKYDAEYRALTELSKAVNLLERARSQGLQGTEAYARIQDNVTLKLQAQANAAKIANAEQQRLSATIRGQAQASINSVTGVKLDFDTDTRAADIAAYGAELDRLREKFVPLYALSQQFARSQKEVADALAVGAISTNEAAAAQLKLTRAYEDSTQKMERLDRTRKESAQRSVNSQLIVPDRGGDVQAYGAELDRLQAKYDPLFAAQQRYKAGLDELRQTFATGAISQDVFTRNLAEQKAAFAEQINALGLYSQAQRNAATAAAELAQAQTNAANKAKAQASVNAQSTPGYSQADAEAFAKSFDDLQARYDPMFAAQRQYQAELRGIEAAQKSGALTQQTAAKAVDYAANRYNAQIVEIKKAEEANARLAKGVGLNAYAWQNLSFQVNDVVTSLASGISPFQTLAQQGGQIYQILQTSQGGVGGALKAIAERLAAINPLVGVFAVLAAGAALAAVALNNFAKAQRDVELALLGAGRGAGLSADQIQKIAEQASATSTITVSAARDIEKAFLESGKVYGEVFAKGITAADDFAKKTGSKPVEAAKLLADALSDLGGGGFDELAKRAGNFDAAFEKTVKDAINRGNDLEAQRLVVERFGQAFDKAGEKATGLQSVLQRVDQGVKNAAESFGKAISTRINGNSLSDQLEEATRARDVVIKAQKAADVVPDTSAQDEKIRKITAALKEQTVAVQKQAEVVRNNADARDQSGTTALVPAVASFKSLETAAAKANKELSSLEAQQKNGTYVPVDRIAAAKEAVAGAAAGLRDYASSQSGATMEMDKAKKVLAANMQALQAVTPEQKAAAASAKVLAEAYGTAESGTRRSREASDAYNKVMAESRQQTINTNRAQTESADASSRVADANTKTGNSVAFLTAQNKALAEAKAGTISQDEVENRTKVILREQLQAENQSRSEAIRAARDQTAVQQALNDKVAAQKMTAQEAQRRQANDIELSKLQREADAAQGEEKGALTVRLGELTTAYEAQISAEKRTQVLTMSEESSRQIEQLEKEGELLGLNNRERAIELAALQAKQNLQRQGISVDAPESVEYINKEKLKADLTYAKDQYQRLSQDITSALGGIFDDMTGSGKKNLTTFFDSFSKGFSKIGTRMLEQNLIGPLINGGLDGKGGAAGQSIFDKIGSLFGGGGQAEKAIAGGSEKGIFSGITSLFSDSKNGASNGGFAKSGFGGALASAAVGGSIGYSSQSPMVGAVGGALTGFATGGVVGGLIGGAAGILGGLFGESQAKKQAKKQLQQEMQARREAYEQAKPQIEALDKTFLGESIGAVGAKIVDAETQLKQAAKTASDAGDSAKANKLVADFQSYTARLRAVFSDSFEGVLQGVQKGFGTDGPFASAVGQVQQFGESLKAFVADAAALPDPVNGQRARAAAVEGALSSLDPTPTLSETQTQIQKIQGTAAGLNQVLKDLGLSADQAATAINARTNKALDALAAKFNNDLERKINDAQGKDYLNDASDLIKEVGSLNADAAALGQDTGRVSVYFQAAAQKIVDSSQLTGDAFQELVTKFPELNGLIHDYSEEVKNSADVLAAAKDRAAGFQDRLFAATHRDDTLANSLATFDRTAEKDRAAEVKAGGQALVDLEAAQAAERANILIDYGKKVAENLKAYNDRYEAAANPNPGLGGQLATHDLNARNEYEAAMAAGQSQQELAGLNRALVAERARIVEDYNNAVRERQNGFNDRAFTAGNDASTLAGQLAAFERSAYRDRLNEMKAGGEAINQLTAAQEAERAKIIRDYYEAVNTRIKGYQDRIFDATNDSTTLAGQLAAFDRKAAAEREAEIKAGGEAMAYLEQAQMAERIKVIQDFGKQAKTAFDDFAATIRKFLDGLVAGSDSPLSPEQRLAAAQSQYDEQLKLAQGGDKTAMGDITTYAQSLLDASKAYYASSQGFQDTFAKVLEQLGKLPDQVGVQAFGGTGSSSSPPGSAMSQSVMAVIASQYVSPAGAVNDDGPAAPRLTMPTGPNSEGAALLAELRSIGARLDSLRGDVKENTGVTEEGAMQQIAATKDIGTTLARGKRADSRQEVAA